MPDMNNLGLALQGLGAGIRGGGTEFTATVNAQREAQRQAAEAQRQERLKTFYADSEMSLNAIINNQPQIAAQMWAERSDLLQGIPGADPIDSDTMNHLFAIAQSGDEEAKKRIVDTLSMNVQRGRSLGYLAQAPKPFRKVEGGQVITEGPNGSFVATDIEGYRDSDGGGKVGTVSPKDFTVESMAAYEKTGNIRDLVRHRPAIKEISGIPYQFNQETDRWESLVNMNDPRLSDDVKKLAEIEAEKQSRLDFAKQQSKWQAGETKLVSKISSAKSKHKILTNTVNEIRKMRSAWSTRYGSALKGLPATEARKMAGLFRTVKANSTFGTLTDLKASGGTLGAIAVPELELLGAALGELDQLGDAAEQDRVLDQILTANQSSLARLDKSYQLDRSKYGTSFADPRSSGSTPSPAGQGSNGLSDEDLLKKYGG
jgi:hypothetical protein